MCTCTPTSEYNTWEGVSPNKFTLLIEEDLNIICLYMYFLSNLATRGGGENEHSYYNIRSTLYSILPDLVSKQVVLNVSIACQ